MAVCARCAEPLVATARFCAACGSPVLLNTTPKPEVRADSRAGTVPVPVVAGAPDPFARTVNDPNATDEARKAATAAAAARPGTVPIVAVAPARPNPVSPMASSVMNTPGDPVRPPAGAAAPWNVIPSGTPNPYAPAPLPVDPRGPAPFVPGAMVLVHWSNGQRYPGTVLQTAGSQILVAFPNGQQHWVDVQYVIRGA